MGIRFLKMQHARLHLKRFRQLRAGADIGLFTNSSIIQAREPYTMKPDEIKIYV